MTAQKNGSSPTADMPVWPIWAAMAAGWWVEQMEQVVRMGAELERRGNPKWGEAFDVLRACRDALAALDQDEAHA